ncbi:M23 family metallopeptidase [Skermania piniformis]
MSLDLESARADEHRAGTLPVADDVTEPVHVVDVVEDVRPALPVAPDPLEPDTPEPSDTEPDTAGSETEPSDAEPDTAGSETPTAEPDTDATDPAAAAPVEVAPVEVGVGRRRRDRVVLGLVAALALVVGADAIPARGGESTGGGLPEVLAYQPVPGAVPLDLTHPQQVLLSPRSVQRYLNQVANGEQIREQRVVADAAAATQLRAGLAAPPPTAALPSAALPAPAPAGGSSTLDQAKREAAAAAAGQWQPWMGGSPSALAAAGIGGIAPGANGFVVPARGTFTSAFGPRWGTYHQGIDIANAIGTPIYAVAAGTVIDAGPASGFGLWVRIRHDDGTITVYGHMYDFFVSVGERVPAGMQIARIGNRGDSSGPHLHFEVIVDGQHVDPQLWLAQRGIALTS